MLADINRVGARVCWLIGARSDQWAFDVEDDRFNKAEIRTAIIETESEIVRDLVEAYHPQRNQFLEWVEVADGGTVPARIGQIANVRIKAFPTATEWISAKPTTATNIELWRENYGKTFDAKDHDEEGSTLSGFYDLTNDVLTFTGHEAQVQICTYVPDFGGSDSESESESEGAALQLDSMWETLIVDGAVAKLAKIGAASGIVSHYAQRYLYGRQRLLQGMSYTPEINVEQKQ